MANADKLCDSKKTLSIFCPSKESPLSYSDLLVYCFRAYQDGYSTIPSCRRVAKSTGLREKTVADASCRLQEHGLLTGDCGVITPSPHLNWFVPLESLREKFPEGPEFRWLQNWRALVRNPGADNPLSVPCILIYSLIRHSVLQKWKPSQGWSHQYLGQVTGANEKTVASALTTLEESGFLRVGEGMQFTLYKLGEAQLRCFADRGVWSGNSSEPDVIVEELSPLASAFGAKQVARAELIEYLNRFPITNPDRDHIYKVVTKSPEWPSGWKERAFKLIEAAMPRSPLSN